MTHSIKGVVDQVTTKTVNTKYGDKTVYGFVVDGVEFSTGFKKEHQDGELVNVAVEYKYREWKKIPNKTGDGLPPATAGGPGGGSVSPISSGGSRGGTAMQGKTFPVAPTHPDMSIIRQNSMNRAVEILETWMDNGIAEFNSQDVYLDRLQEVALIVCDFNSGQDIAKQIAAKQQLKAAEA